MVARTICGGGLFLLWTDGSVAEVRRKRGGSEAEAWRGLSIFTNMTKSYNNVKTENKSLFYSWE